MSLWAKAKAANSQDIDWRREWEEIAIGTLDRTGPQPNSVLMLVEQLDQAYLKRNVPEFRRLKAQLENQPSWGAWLVDCVKRPGATSVTSTDPSTTPASPTLWDASTDSSSPSK